MSDADQKREELIRRRAERATDIYLGRLMRFHPEYAVTPKNPAPVVTIIEPAAAEQEVVCLPVTAEINRNHPPIDLIIKETASFYEISPNDILSARREKWVADARHVACWLSRNLTTRSLPEIAARIGGRDHTTIMASIRKVQARKEFDNRLEDELRILTARIRERQMNQRAA